MSVPTHSDGILASGHSIADAATVTPAVKPSLNVLPQSFYTRFLSDVAKKQGPSPIRGLFPLEKTPGVISLLAGKPNLETFPFSSLSFTAYNPLADSCKALGQGAQDASATTEIKLTPEALAEGLQYTGTDGISSLNGWLHGLQQLAHGGREKSDAWRVSVGAGSQDLIFKAVACLVNKGDSVLLEAPMYAGVIPMFQNLDCDQIEIETDDKGISSASLRKILESWPEGKPKPKVLYTVPYGCNPTGMTATLERRKEVLSLAREHDFLILEDDPYFYLYYGDAPRYPSYFCLELQEPEVGRVLRFDSFSKVLSAGIRIGFATGPVALLTAIDQFTATANLQVSSLTQAIAFALLNTWGYEGLFKHTSLVSTFYKGKRDIFERVLNKYLKGLAAWSTPEAGMFFWFKLLIDGAEEDSQVIIRDHAFKNGVLALPGTVFMPNGGKTAYVRASFSQLGEVEVEEAVKRIRDTILQARADIHVQ